MKRNIYWLFGSVILICLYVLFLRFPSVTYFGETELWKVELNAKLVSTEGSYQIKLTFKEEKKLDHLVFDIYPHYGEGWISELDDSGEYVYRCEGCGYYDHDKELLFFIKWKEEATQLEYDSELFTLEKK